MFIYDGYFWFSDWRVHGRASQPQSPKTGLSWGEIPWHSTDLPAPETRSLKVGAVITLSACLQLKICFQGLPWHFIKRILHENDIDEMQHLVDLDNMLNITMFYNYFKKFHQNLSDLSKNVKKKNILKRTNRKQ